MVIDKGRAGSGPLFLEGAAKGGILCDVGMYRHFQWL